MSLPAPEVIALLGRTPLFADLNSADLGQVALLIHERVFEPGQLIFARGDPGQDVYLVAEGRVRLSILSEDGRALAFSHASRGQIFGEIAALDGGTRSADATALSRVHALVLARTALNQLIASHPQIAMAAIALLCKRVRATSDQLEGVVLNPIEVRLAKLLMHTLRVRELLGNTHVRIDLGISQSEVALLIGTSRQSVNTALTALENQGVLRRAGSGLDCDVAKLGALALSE